MLSYCLKCKKKKKNMESKNAIVEKTQKGRIMLSSNSTVCSSKKSRFKDQRARS